MSKNPEPDTGTSIYQAKGYSLQYIKELQIKQSHYLGEQISDEEYDQAFDAMMEQYTETVTRECLQRFVLFSSKTHHGVKTFGSKPRLTLNFFGMGMSSIPPLQRSR